MFTLLKQKGTVGWKMLLDNALCTLKGTRAGPERPLKALKESEEFNSTSEKSNTESYIMNKNGYSGCYALSN